MDPAAIVAAVAADLKIEVSRVQPAVELLDAGNTIPFIARYRKEATGVLDEEQLRQVDERLGYRRNMEARRETVLRSLEEQGVLTPELQSDVAAAGTLQRIEDLYRPFRPRRRTRATIARERGLQALADLILAQPPKGDRMALGKPFINEQVPAVEDAYAGARDIVAEVIDDDPAVREPMRELTLQRGQLSAQVAEPNPDTRGVYQSYYAFTSAVRGLRPHQILALNRGEREEALRIELSVPEAEAAAVLARSYPARPGSPLAADLTAARDDSYTRLLFPAVVREVRGLLTESADEHAIRVFATNLRALLLQSPLRGQTVLAIDPGYRTGGKVAVVDPTGKVLATTTIYPDRQAEQAAAVLRTLIERHDVTVVAIGNGTAGRETEAFVASLIAAGAPVKYTMVNEAGASVYSASKLAREELPDLDVSLRGAVSIARRLQDPLAELVKIEPNAIGVGLYQHDVDQKLLARTLDAVIESAVNRVGADLNTASPALLRYVSGIGPKLAEAIVAYRNQNGAFTNRRALRQVAGLGAKTFEQAVGFLRVIGGDTDLDATPIHPESYAAARKVLAYVGQPLGAPSLIGEINELRRQLDLDEFAAAMGIGRPTLEDILDALARPGRDPRDEAAGPILRSDVLSLQDLKVGMRLQGTVRNVVDFGAFVDIGVKRDGLVHISQMDDGYIRSPHDRVAVGDVVEVEVLEVDLTRERISLRLA